ncbi:MAG: amidohydrolase [Bacteroidales bacterium]|jgi:5-methylthioadenosine/S-adenosylhomocysteine deaminase|nr:amidohydrolase [Bacteroidales bacterium]
MSTILLKRVVLKGEQKDILIKGNRIAVIADSIPVNAKREIDCKGKSVIPGFVNMHTHSAMSLMRGISEDIPLTEWLNKIWDIEKNLQKEEVYWGAKLAILEMIKTGTTSFLDMYWMSPQVAQAVEEMGIRGVLTYVFLDHFDTEKAEKQKSECIRLYDHSKKWHKRCEFGVSIHADYTVSPHTMVWASGFAKENGLILNTHISETEKEVLTDKEKYGKSPVAYYDSLGILDSNVIAAHALWLDDEDIEILAKRGVTAVHNVNSNLKLASGYRFRYGDLKAAGINVCLGTDGAASSNNLDMRESMKTMTLLQKAWTGDTTTLPLNELMDVATINGARALDIDAGRIEEGALADLVLVDTRSEAFTPNINFESNFIYSANSSCIDTVICDGNILMEGRKVAGEEQVLEKADEMAWKLINAR